MYRALEYRGLRCLWCCEEGAAPSPLETIEAQHQDWAQIQYIISFIMLDVGAMQKSAFLICSLRPVYTAQYINNVFISHEVKVELELKEFTPFNFLLLCD